VIALSSTEAEYIAAAETATIVNLHRLLSDLSDLSDLRHPLHTSSWTTPRAFISPRTGTPTTARSTWI
jgi:hypothetical protein